MTATQPLLDARSLRIVTGARIDLALPGGQIHCISGPSGSGKTRLLRALADLDDTPGEVRLDGRPRQAFRASDWRRLVMLSPAQPRWWLDNIAQHCADMIDGWAEALNLSAARLQAPIEELSTGEQARGGLLRSLCRRPQVLLLDEPTGALDSGSRAAVEALLLDWLGPQRAILWVSHDSAQIRRVAHQHWRLDATGLQAA